MNPEQFTDPRDNAFQLLLRVSEIFEVWIEGFDRARRLPMRGEIHLDGLSPLSVRPQRLEVRRLGFFSLEAIDEQGIGEISVSSAEALAILAPNSSTGGWNLSMPLATHVSYHLLTRERPRLVAADYSAATAERFEGSLSLELKFDPEAPPYQASVDFAIIQLSCRGEGPVRALALQAYTLGAESKGLRSLGSRAFFVRPAERVDLFVPLKPVRFPLNQGQTGGTWEDQLKRANDIWSTCGIKFIDLPFHDHNDRKIPDKPFTGDVFASYQLAGAIEVFFVTYDHGGYTEAAGTAFAGIIIPEVPDQDINLLAHELSHVLASCDDECKRIGEIPLWKGEAGTVTIPEPRPISGSTSPYVCMSAQASAQPLLQALLKEEDYE